jgi:hypothetical protein
MYHPGICAEGFKKTTTNLNEDSQYPSRDPNWSLLKQVREVCV